MKAKLVEDFKHMPKKQLNTKELKKYKKLYHCTECGEELDEDGDCKYCPTMKFFDGCIECGEELDDDGDCRHCNKEY